MDGEVEIRGGAETIHLYLSRVEFSMVLGSLNEAMEALDDWEFPVRLGVDLKEVLQFQFALTRIEAEMQSLQQGGPL
jgi:hypothetical protein